MLGVDRSPDRLQVHLLLLDAAEDSRGRRGALRHRGRDVLGAADAAGDEYAFGHRRDRVQLGVLLDGPAVEAARDAEADGQLLGIGAWLETGREDDHVDREAALLSDQGVFDLED